LKKSFPTITPSHEFEEAPVHEQQERQVQLEKKPELMQHEQQEPKDRRAPISIEQEITLYLASENLLEPGDFCYKYKHEFPLLSRLYTKVPCVVASG
jgi:hypothetical protein